MTRTVPAGSFGKFYAARHAWGQYHSCGVTGTYIFSKDIVNSTPDYFVQLLKYALYHTIERHPALCYGLVENTPEVEAHFSILETIEWEDAVEFQNLSVAKPEQDAALSKLIGETHEYRWKDQDTKPAWKVTVLKHEPEDSDTTVRIDVLFINNHAIGDGTSSANFHKSFLRFLQQALSKSDIETSWPYKVPAVLPRISYLEEAYPLPSQPPQTLAAANTTTSTTATPLAAAPPAPLEVFAFAPPSFSFSTFRSKVQALTVPPATVTTALQECRRLKTTLTGLLHSLIIIHLATKIPHANGFCAATPYSMRRFTGASEDEMLNHISEISLDWDADTLSLARAAAEGSPEEDAVIERISSQYSTAIAEELENVPIRGPLSLHALASINNDFDKFCRDMIAKPQRGTTYEVSNVGAIKLPATPAGSEGVELEKLTFTQSAMVTGAALGCSVISIRGKSLVVGVSWQEGIVEDELVDELLQYLEKRFLGFGKTVA